MRWFRWRRWLLCLLFGVTLAGCGSTATHTTTQTTTATTIPVKPGAVAPPPGEAPGCDAQVQREIEAGHGELGACAPKPSRFGGVRPTLPSGETGPDVSNNDPFYNWHPVKAHGHPFGYLKTIQGTAFVDSTASAMASAARAARVLPGAYDFLEVCRTSSAGEARLFASRLKAIGLVSHAFVPVGDAEWPLRLACSASAARSWLTSWSDTVHSLTGRWPGFYTGAWWWNPNVGCWRPPHALRWVSGYGSRASLPIPCGWAGVDLWQYTDAGFNGVSTTDMSRLEVPQSVFVGSAGPSPVQLRAAKLASLRSHEKELAELHGDIDRHHCRPGQHSTPRSPTKQRRAYHELCGRWLTRGGVVVGVVKRLRHELGLKETA